METQKKVYSNAAASLRNTLYQNGTLNQSKVMKTVNNMFSKYQSVNSSKADNSTARSKNTEKYAAADTVNNETDRLDTTSIGLQLKEAVDSIFDPTTGMTDEQKKRFVEKIYKKLESGKELTADEMQYLRMHDPVTYAKAAKVQVLRESLKKQLENAKSKEEAADVYLQNMERIGDDDIAKKEIQAAYKDVYEQFRKSESYKKLPDTRKEAKEDKKDKIYKN